ncbi:phosphatase PAP2 family protein [Roseibium salinum]|uniref:Phosphatase PAP2 family protein n=1 Tax=Roseibium salinum TaxID=1604349 RepID=A0ABT3R8K8_9HYPH|nr:phosphatase PAP2 family protein [Roseibium sp. DSM 29163]MCX2725646.1 phosphatase PAP2 family protein [Roseibium sp. DSM 29163]
MTKAIYVYRYAILLLVLHVAASVFAFEYFKSTPVIITSSVYVTYAALCAIIAAPCILIALTIKLFVNKHPNPTTELIQMSRFWFNNNHNGIHIITTYVLFLATFSVFGTVKSTLPQLVPFQYDLFFYQLDQKIFGVDPYELLLPIFGGDWQLFILNNAYQAWLVAMVASILWVTFSSNHLRRLEYLFASILSFAISGNLLAVTFSSAGPCFFGPLLGLDYYAPLLDHLNEVNERTGTVWALVGQHLLWDYYANSKGFISGISAMPSLHTIFAWLWVFAAWQHRALRIVTIIYAIMIFIGSIVLGWHYAVDGIAGFVLALLAWAAARPIARASLRGAEGPAGVFASDQLQKTGSPARKTIRS